MKLVDEQKKVELKETALIAMQRSNNLIQEENQKLLQTLMNERSTVAMLKETMSKIFNGVRHWLVDSLWIFEPILSIIPNWSWYKFCFQR